MEKNVLISIRGTQKADGEAPQVIELTTDGKLSRKSGVYSVSYVESEVTGMKDVVTTFRVYPDQIVLVREGPLKSEMIFAEGRKNESLYDLGFGALLVGVQAKKVSSDLNEEGGKLFVDYSVEVEHTLMGTNTYEIEVHSAERPCPN